MLKMQKHQAAAKGNFMIIRREQVIFDFDNYLLLFYSESLERFRNQYSH